MGMPSGLNCGSPHSPGSPKLINRSGRQSRSAGHDKMPAQEEIKGQGRRQARRAGCRRPLLLSPIYWVLERIPAARDSARRLGLVTIEQMVRALAGAVENPSQGVRILEVPQIRACDQHDT